MFYWTFDKWFKQLVKLAGLPHFSLHDLRKTCNTLMKNAGVSPEAAMQNLGHTTFKVNQRHYTGS
jgi:integrase